MKLTDLCKERVSAFQKSNVDESFLESMNELLALWEAACYEDYPIDLPILIVCGVPRAGSTLVTQMLARCLDIGYINHLIARFWLSPVTGIRLSQNVFGGVKGVDYSSFYAHTEGVANLHAFGYFWRYWLRIDSTYGPQGEVDWCRLQRVLLNMTHAFGRGICFKGLFCTFYVSQLIQQIPKVLFVYVTRDPLDMMVSILDGRERYYGDTSKWFGVSPREYSQLKDCSDIEQIVGQVYYLRKEFESHANKVSNQHIVRVSLEELCSDPSRVLQRVVESCRQFCAYDLRRVIDPPESFGLHCYDDREEDKERFRRVMMNYPKDLW